MFSREATCNFFYHLAHQFLNDITCIDAVKLNLLWSHRNISNTTVVLVCLTCQTPAVGGLIVCVRACESVRLKTLSPY